MTLTTVLLGLSLYFLVGMVLAHHTKLGSNYYPTSPIRLTFFWIVPLVGFVFWFVGSWVIIGSDIFLFGDKETDPRLSTFIE